MLTLLSELKFLTLQNEEQIHVKDSDYGIFK